MRVLLAAAVALVAAFSSAAGAAPRTQTLYSLRERDDLGLRAGRRDHRLVRAGRASLQCRARAPARQRHERRPAEAGRRVQRHLPVADGACARVTRDRLGASRTSCGRCTRTRRSSSTISSAPACAIRASAASSNSRTPSHGAGLWLGGVAGDGATLVYGVTSVDYVDEAGCLAGTDTCALKIVQQGGGVFRIVDGQRLKLIPGTSGAVAVAASGSRVAYVAAASIAKDGSPVAGGDLPIEVVDSVTRPRDLERHAAGDADRVALSAARARNARAHAARPAARLVLAQHRIAGRLGAGRDRDEPDALGQRPGRGLPRRPLDPRRRASPPAAFERSSRPPRGRSASRSTATASRGPRT